MFHIAPVSPRMVTVAQAPTEAEPAAVTVPLPTRLQAITDAYTAGDAPRAEQLFLEALDECLPWDMVCAAAARGIAAHRAGGSGA